MLERRRYVRICLPIRAEYKPLEIKAAKKDTILRDIGAGGVCLYSDEGLGANRALSLDIFFPDGLGSLSAQAKIAWARQEDEKNLVGLEFTNISSFDRSRIISFVNIEKQKEKSFLIKPTSQIVFFKETEIKDKAEVLNLLLTNIDKVQPDLRVVDKNIDLTDEVKLDILCVDSYGALVLTELFAEENEFILVHALKHYDWVMRHADILCKIYRLKINSNLRPRVILIAPRFSEPFKRLIESISTMIDILILEYVCIESKESKGIFLKKATQTAVDAISPKDLTPHDKEDEKPTDKPQLSG